MSDKTPPPVSDEQIFGCLRDCDPDAVRLAPGFKLFAYAIASKRDVMWLARLEEAQKRISELERNGPAMQRGVRGDGSPWMGTMLECLEDEGQLLAREDALIQVRRLMDYAAKQAAFDNPGVGSA